MLLAQMPAPQIPELPAGPALDRVRGPVEMAQLQAWQIGLMAGLAVVLCACLAWGLTRGRRARRRPTASVAPHVAALAELEAAAAHTANDDERFAVLSSGALRRYLEARSGCPAAQKTTREWLDRLEEQAVLEGDALAALSEWMQHCDRVKFARASLSAAQRTELTSCAQTLIHQFEQRFDAEPAKRTESASCTQGGAEDRQP